MGGPCKATGLVSVEYTFRGQTAHSAGAPWRGRSALDAVELMNIGWNYRREHLPLEHRSHYVITNGGDQPNVVPRTASVWYYFRQTTYPKIKELWEIGDSDRAGRRDDDRDASCCRRGCSARRGRSTSTRPIAESDVREHPEGRPAAVERGGSDARAGRCRRSSASREQGLTDATCATSCQGPVTDNRGGGSDDIGDISWNVPTVTLRYPSNIPGLPGHNWANAIAMATPIAHKGVTAGAKVQAMTMIDLLTKPALVDSRPGTTSATCRRRT